MPQLALAAMQLAAVGQPGTSPAEGVFHAIVTVAVWFVSSFAHDVADELGRRDLTTAARALEDGLLRLSVDDRVGIGLWNVTFLRTAIPLFVMRATYAAFWPYVTELSPGWLSKLIVGGVPVAGAGAAVPNSTIAVSPPTAATTARRTHPRVLTATLPS